MDVLPGVSMTAPRLARVAGLLLLLGVWPSCGDYYRPVATPIAPTQPNPAFTHLAVVINGNGAANPGSSTTIDVSGDSAVSQSTVGLVPVHAALLQGGTRVYVANSQEDTVSTFSPGIATPVSTIPLPSGCGTPPCSKPDFVAGTEFLTVYVANSASSTVSAISTIDNVVTNTIPVGVNPVAMAETPDQQKLYVANAGSNGTGGSVTSINTIDKSVNPPVVNGTWISPVWVVARSDSQMVYVLDQGTGNVSAIDPASNTVVNSVPVGAGADFMVYDPTLNRLYVTNPAAGTVTCINAATDALVVPPVAVANAVSVAALPDGTRVYVSSAAVSAGTVTSQVTVLNTASLSVKTTIPLTAVPAVCATRTHSELFMAAAADSSRVYVGNCDAGNTAVIQTSDDTLVLQVPAPLSAQAPTAPVNGECPNRQLPKNGICIAPQNPVFVLAGP